MSTESTSLVPSDLAVSWGRELGRARRGGPHWTVRARSALCLNLAAHGLDLAAALARPYQGYAERAEDGSIVLTMLCGGAVTRFVVDPRSGIWEGGGSAGRNGLLGVASRLWTSDGDPIGPLSVADRFVAGLGLAALRNGGAK